MKLSLAEALRMAIHGEMKRDNHVCCIGEDIGITGGTSGDTADFETTAPLFQLGWQYNKYVAIEFRYQKSEIKSSVNPAFLGGSGELTTLDYSNTSLFLKPQSTFKDFTGYALLGYGQVKADSDRIFDSSMLMVFNMV